MVNTPIRMYGVLRTFFEMRNNELLINPKIPPIDHRSIYESNGKLSEQVTDNMKNPDHVNEPPLDTQTRA